MTGSLTIRQLTMGQWWIKLAFSFGEIMGLIRYLLLLYALLSFGKATVDHMNLLPMGSEASPISSIETSKPDAIMAAKAVLVDQDHSLRLLPLMAVLFVTILPLWAPALRLLLSLGRIRFTPAPTAYYYLFSGLSPPRPAIA